MTYDQIVSTILMRLGNRPALRGMIEAEMDFVKEFTLERDPQVRPWFLLTEGAQTLATVADQAYVSLEADFLAEYEYAPLWVEDPDDGDRLARLKKDDYDILYARNTDATGLPLHYAVVGKRVYLFPTPDAVYNVRHFYYQKTGTLKDSTTNPWILYGADWLMNATGAVVAEQIQNTKALQIFEARAVTARKRIMGETIEWHEANIERRPGELL